MRKNNYMMYLLIKNNRLVLSSVASSFPVAHTSHREEDGGGP